MNMNGEKVANDQLQPPATPAAEPPQKGPLTAEQLNTFANQMAADIVKNFSEATGAKLTWGHWQMLHALIARFGMAGFSGIQNHLLGCATMWAAMLGPDDQGPLLIAIDDAISLGARDDNPELVASLRAVREKVAFGLDQPPPPPAEGQAPIA